MTPIRDWAGEMSGMLEVHGGKITLREDSPDWCGDVLFQATLLNPKDFWRLRIIKTALIGISVGAPDEYIDLCMPVTDEALFEWLDSRELGHCPDRDPSEEVYRHARLTAQIWFMEEYSDVLRTLDRALRAIQL